MDFISHNKCEHKHNTWMGSNEFSQTEEFHSKEALFGNMVKPVWNPSALLEKGSGRLCLINQGLIPFWPIAIQFQQQEFFPATFWSEQLAFKLKFSIHVFIHCQMGSDTLSYTLYILIEKECETIKKWALYWVFEIHMAWMMETIFPTVGSLIICTGFQNKKKQKKKHVLKTDL